MANQMLFRKLPSTGDMLSILGYGAMRFPRMGMSVDEVKADQIVAAAAEMGINYFDTAYIYPGSERALGKAISRLKIRKDIKISTKLPTMMVKNRHDMDNIIEKQLERLKTDYIDYYLAHSLTSYADFVKLADKGFIDFIESERKRGRIRCAGFSFHGNVHDFKRIVDAYAWALCMIQFNYLDEKYQAGVEGMRYASGKGLGVVAMEPLRGGLLGSGFSGEAQKIFDEHLPGERIQDERLQGGRIKDKRPPDDAQTPGAPCSRTPAELALRWVWQFPGITSALSGSGEVRYVEANCKTVYAIYAYGAGLKYADADVAEAEAGADAAADAAAEVEAAAGAAAEVEAGADANAGADADGIVSAGNLPDDNAATFSADGRSAFSVCLNETEIQTVKAVQAYYHAYLRVLCTSCSYCMPCPYGVDIPTCFFWYNMNGLQKGFDARVKYVIATEGAINSKPSKASLCNSCGQCERNCPQKIEIRRHLKDVANEMEKKWFRIPLKLAFSFISNPKT